MSPRMDSNTSMATAESDSQRQMGPAFQSKKMEVRSAAARPFYRHSLTMRISLTLGVSGLPRVIDALSTIMWPSLVQSTRATQRTSRVGDLLDWATVESEADGDANVMRELTASQVEVKEQMEREMDALESWLQEDTDEPDGRVDLEEPVESGDHDDPWSTAKAHGYEYDIHHDDGHTVGFEDDFDEFVGAPMDVTYGYDRPTTSSLASSVPHRAFTDNFAPVTKKVVTAEDDILDFDDDEDPDLPSHAEVEEMSRRLFGSALLAPPSTSHTWERLHSPLVSSDSTDLPSDLPEQAPPTTTDFGAHRRSEFSPLGDDGVAVDGHEADDFEFEQFDFSKVLGALQGVKEEIAGMADEDERRKAAARVALGLVYGLRKEDERERRAEEA